METETLDLAGLNAFERGYELGKFCLSNGDISDVLKFIESHSKLACRATIKRPREKIVLSRSGGDAGPIQSAEKILVSDAVELISELSGFACAIAIGHLELKKSYLETRNAAAEAISIAAALSDAITAKTTTPAKEQ